MADAKPPPLDVLRAAARRVRTETDEALTGRVVLSSDRTRATLFVCRTGGNFVALEAQPLDRYPCGLSWDRGVVEWCFGAEQLSRWVRTRVADVYRELGYQDDAFFADLIETQGFDPGRLVDSGTGRSL